MILGIVKGTVVATRKMPELVGYKFLLVEPVFGSKKDTIVAGDNMGPAKLRKAEKLGVKIISEEDFIAMIGSDEIPAANAAEKRTEGGAEGSAAHKDVAEPKLF